MKTIEEINQANVKKIAAEKKLPNFFPGDIVKIGVRITEGKRDRIQYFEGVCIAKKNRDLNSSILNFFSKFFLNLVSVSLAHP